MTRRGFTLIELLVVVSIIALLIAILLPALQQARHTAQSIGCVNAKRQYVVGLVTYTIDNEGRFPNWKRGWMMMTPHDIEWFMLATLQRDYAMPATWSGCTLAPNDIQEQVQAELDQRLTNDPGFASGNPKWILQTTSYWVMRGRPDNSAGCSFENRDRYIISDRLENQLAHDMILADKVTIGPATDFELSSHHRTGPKVMEIAGGFSDGSARLIPAAEIEVRFPWTNGFAW